MRHDYAIYRISPQNGSRTFMRIIAAESAEQAESKARERFRSGCYEAHRISDVFERLAANHERLVDA